MQALLQVSEVTVRFGGLVAVNRLSFDVHEGEILGLIGPNGAGKTTVFNALTGYVRPSEGFVLFEGRQLTRLPPHEIARTGLVRTFQKRSFFPGISVLENLRTAALQPHRASGKGRLSPKARLLGAQDAVTRTDELLELVGLQRKRDATAGNLPYGEQRILGVAIALAARPRLLLLDEPCAGMTPGEVDRTIELIGKLRLRGSPMVVVEHQMRFLMGISDRVVVLDHGLKLAEGKPAEVRENPAVIEAYLGRGVHERRSDTHHQRA